MSLNGIAILPIEGCMYVVALHKVLVAKWRIAL